MDDTSSPKNFYKDYSLRDHYLILTNIDFKCIDAWKDFLGLIDVPENLIETLKDVQIYVSRLVTDHEKYKF